MTKRKSKMNFCQVWVTCESEAEASKIADALLQKRLIACAKQYSVNSRFHWQGKIDNSDEILLLMDSHEDLFAELERVVSELHSYDTPNLQATPVGKIAKGTSDWLKKELKK